MSRCFQNVMCFLKLIIRKNFVLKQLISLQRHSGKLIESISTIVQTYIHTNNRCIRGVYKLITYGNWKQFSIVCSLCLLDLKKMKLILALGLMVCLAFSHVKANCSGDCPDTEEVVWAVGGGCNVFRNKCYFDKANCTRRPGRFYYLVYFYLYKF